MYPDVVAWLKERLIRHFRKADSIIVSDTSQTYLWRFLADNGYEKYFPEYLTYEIQVDITGVVVAKGTAKLAFVECKLSPITLKDVSQLLGYSKVASPLTSLLISSSGISSSIDRLLNVYRRFDVLEYDKNRTILVGCWNAVRKEIDVKTLLPKGQSLFP